MPGLPRGDRMDPKSMAAQNMIKYDGADPTKLLGFLTDVGLTIADLATGGGATAAKAAKKVAKGAAKKSTENPEEELEDPAFADPDKAVPIPKRFTGNPVK